MKASELNQQFKSLSTTRSRSSNHL